SGRAWPTSATSPTLCTAAANADDCGKHSASADDDGEHARAGVRADDRADLGRDDVSRFRQASLERLDDLRGARRGIEVMHGNARGFVGSHRHCEFFESSYGPRRRPDALEWFDAAITQTQQRLHRERRPDQCARRTDATPATQVFESVT